MSDIKWMQLALKQAEHAARMDEVPIGAVLVADDKLLASGFNQPISSHDPSAHAEIVCLRNAAQLMQNYRLLDTTLYVTLEPCLMCAGALIQARIKRLVYAASEPKSGAIESVFKVFDNPIINHHPEIQGGILANQAKDQLQTFFRNKRK